MIRMTYNINTHVRVRLTETGREYLRTSGRGYTSEQAEDDAGWSRWQLWRLMHVFGPLLDTPRVGHLPFETTIELERQTGGGA